MHKADATIQPILEDRLSLLHVAVSSKENLPILEILCDAGADVHLTSQDDSGSTPLHIAVHEGVFENAEYLLKRGASPDIEDLGDTTSFQLAMRNRNRAMVRLLYPKTTARLSSISASEWRLCSGNPLECNLEMISGESAQVNFKDGSLIKELNELWYPLSSESEILPDIDNNFMHKHRNGKRIL